MSGSLRLLPRGSIPLFLAGATLLLQACAVTPYRYGTDREELDDALYPPMREQFVHGRPHALLDAADWYWPGSLLSKLLLWNADMDSHEISDCTLARLKAYLEDNNLEHTQVLVNAYSPGNQWIRLFTNDAVGAAWRYTIGFLSVVYYTILPGRFFGGDAFNPYTNTIYLYSDDAAVALHEGGHAKDFARREYKGLNAAIYALPFAALYYEARATGDALGYSLDQGDLHQMQDGYETMYPAYSTYVGGSFTTDPILATAGVIPGHIVGRIASARAEVADPPPTPPRRFPECESGPPDDPVNGDKAAAPASAGGD